MMKYYNGPVWLHCPISYPIDASQYLGMWLDLMMTHRQTWLFSSTSTYHSNWPPDHMWHRLPGCPRNKWLDQLWNDSTGPIGDLWRCAVDRGHSGAMPQWPSPATWPWWWWWWYVAYYMSFSGQFPILGPNYLGSDVSVSQPIRRSYKVIMFLYTS